MNYDYARKVALIICKETEADVDTVTKELETTDTVTSATLGIEGYENILNIYSKLGCLQWIVAIYQMVLTTNGIEFKRFENGSVTIEI